MKRGYFRFNVEKEKEMYLKKGVCRVKRKFLFNKIYFFSEE